MSITHAKKFNTLPNLLNCNLTEAEEALYQEQLSDILDYIQRLNTLDTEAIPPTATVLPLRSVMREDVSRPSLPADEILANAPARAGDAFEVRVILED